VAVVTGAARGLGQAEAVALAARGVRVLAVDILDSNETLGAIREAGGEGTALVADLAQQGSAGKVLTAALRAYGDLDIVINNAGLTADHMSFNLSDDDWERVIAVNLSASFYLAREAAVHWRRRDGNGSRRKVIVNTSSESGLYGNAGQANYAAAKAGVAALTLTLATELAPYGIRTNAIAPRARTPMSVAAFADLAEPSRHDPLAPEDVADVVAWLVSDAAREVNGQLLVVHGRGIEVMETWSRVHHVRRDQDWTDTELLMLRGMLFPSGETSRLSKPIGHLFRGQSEERSRDE
jgi:3-oxoacyl-[acyl-carrier protein] reductase